MGRGYVRHVRRKKSLAVINPPQKKRVPHCLLCWIHGWTKNMAEKKGLQKRRLGSLQTKKRLKFIIRKQQKSQETKKKRVICFWLLPMLKKTLWDQCLKKKCDQKKWCVWSLKIHGSGLVPPVSVYIQIHPKVFDSMKPSPLNNLNTGPRIHQNVDLSNVFGGRFSNRDPQPSQFVFFLILREMGQDNIHRLGDVRFLGKRYETYHHCDN